MNLNSSINDFGDMLCNWFPNSIKEKGLVFKWRGNRYIGNCQTNKLRLELWTQLKGRCPFLPGTRWLHKNVVKTENEKETPNPACFANLWNRTRRLIILAPLSTCSAVAWCHMFYLMCKKTFSAAEIVRTWKAIYHFYVTTFMTI